MGTKFFSEREVVLVTVYRPLYGPIGYKVPFRICELLTSFATAG